MDKSEIKVDILRVLANKKLKTRNEILQLCGVTSWGVKNDYSAVLTEMVKNKEIRIHIAPNSTYFSLE